MKPNTLQPGYTLGVTGHRPDAFSGKLELEAFVSILRDEFQSEPRPGLLLTGLALGVDTWAAEIARRLKIPYTAAIPFEGQEATWSEPDCIRYNKLKGAAARVVVVSTGGWNSTRDNWKYQARNEWIVDNCHYLVGFLWRPGGTANCVRYGIRKDRAMRVIDKEILNVEVQKLKEKENGSV